MAIDRSANAPAFRQQGRCPPKPSDANFEEVLSGDPNRKWEALDGVPEIYYVDRRDPANTFVKIKIFVKGTKQDTDAIKENEDRIEKHLSLPGFTVDVEFTESEGFDVHTVDATPNSWTQASIWNPNESAVDLAHEVMHHLGLVDEHDVSKNLSKPELTWSQYLLCLFISATLTIPKDGAQGIMGASYKPPLRRHVDAIVGIKTFPKLQPANDDPWCPR